LSFTRPIVIVLLLAALAFLALRRLPGDSPQKVSRTRILMGTVVEITALGDDADRLQAAITSAFEEMERIDRLMRPDGDGSDVFRISQAPQSAEVSEETAKVIALGLKVARASDGAFDMGLGRLKTLWGIESDHPRVPTPDEIRRALIGTGLGDLHLTGRRVFKDNPTLAVDLGGIAKGYAIDRAIEILRQAGVKNASVNAGGDIRLIGDHQGRPWHIGIQHPRDTQKVLATLSLQGTSVVTSGDYERFFIKDGVRYHHLFAPKTGYPASLCMSATVVAPSATLADALATAAFILGPQKGISLLERFPGVEGLLVGADGKPVLTPGLKGKVTWP
jgi:thiamine biosynthesis lipoprotein